MKLPVLVEPNPKGGIRGKLGSPFDLVIEGANASEVTAKLQLAVAEAAASCQFVLLDVPEIDPIASMLDREGALPDDEMTRAWIQTMKENRILKDSEDERLGREW